MSAWTSTPPKGKGNDSEKWEINYDAEGSVSAQAIFDENGRVVAWAVARSSNWMANPSVDHAHLIATSPELLEVSEMVLGFANEHMPQELIDAAVEAVSKARGLRS